MSAQHTPGPWEKDAYGSFAEVKCRDGSSRGRFAVNVYPAHGSNLPMVRVGAPKGESEDVVQANARLIAAAPDLLAALKSIIENDGGRGSEQFHAIKLFDAREAAFKAIAKAEGRS